MRSYDDRNKPYLFLGLLAMTLGSWYWGITRAFTLPKDVYAKALWYGLLQTPKQPLIYVPVLLTFFYGMLIFAVVVIYYRTYAGFADYVRRLRGGYLVSAAQLRDMCREWFEKQLSFGTIPVPKMIENLQYSVVGSTGSGKSQAIAEFIESALRRSDRLICVDPNGGFMKDFYKPGDIILNPFDERGVSWSIFNEIRTLYDCDQFAVAIIPRSPSTEQEVWNSMARTLVGETMQKLHRLGRGTTEELIYWLIIADNEQLEQMLSDTPARGIFHGAEDTLASIRTVLTRYITPHKYLSSTETASNNFSIREWLATGQSNLWITWREDMLSALKPLVSCWIDVICASALSKDVWEDDRCTDMILDELDSLEKLNYLLQIATKGRKHKFNIMIGLQSHAQLDSTNGEKDALTLRNSCRNTLSLGVAEGDTYTAKNISIGLGSHDVIREHRSGAPNSGPTQHIEKNEPIVSDTEIHTLPALTGYVKLAEDRPIARIRMKYKKRKAVTEPLILVKNKWTEDVSATLHEADEIERAFMAMPTPNADFPAGDSLMN